MKFKHNIEAQAGVKDTTGNLGSAGEVLSSTGTGVEWIAQNAISTSSDFMFYEVKNSSGATINKGKAVMAVGTDGNSGHILIDEMVADGSVESRYFMGVLETTVANGGLARVIAFGELDQFNTLGQNGETWVNGQVLWCDPDSAGDFTITEPLGPNLKIPAAFIMKAATNGKIQIRVQGNEGVKDLYDTKITTQTDGELLVWDNTTGVWMNDDTAIIDYTNGRVGIGTTSPAYKLDVNGSLHSSNITLADGIYHEGDTNTYINFLSDQIQMATAGSVRAYIDSSGNVGIGTTSPTAKLDVVGSAEINGRLIVNQNGVNTRLNSVDANGPVLAFDNNTIAKGFVGSGYHLWVAPNNIADNFGIRAENQLDLGIGSSVKMTIDSSGNVGIGTTSPGVKLEVDGDAKVSSRLQVGTYASADSSIISQTGDIQLRIGSTSIEHNPFIRFQGNNGSNTTYADIKLDAVNQLLVFNDPGTSGGAIGTNPMVLNADGDLGIGTTSPVNELSVIGDIGYTGVIGQGSIYGNPANSSYATMQLYNGSTGYTTLNNQSFGYYFNTGGSNKLTILNGGNVGIGTTSPGAALDVKNVPPSGTGTILNVGFDATNPTRAKIHTENYFGVFSIYDSGSNEDVKLTTNGNSWLNGGNVGIGTTSPIHKLDVNGIIVSNSSNPQLRMLSTANQTNYLVFGDAQDDDVGYIFYEHSSDTLGFRVNAEERMRIASNGNVGIGTTSPSEKIEVSGSVNNDDIAVLIKNNYDDNLSTSRPAAALLFSTASNNGYLRVYGAPADTAANHQIDLGSTAGSSYLTFSPSGSEKMRIASDGNVGIGTTSPGSLLQVGGIADSNGSYGSFNIAGSYGIDSWARSYVVSNTNILSILQADNAALQNGGAYRVTGHIDGTGTDQSSRAVFWNQNGTWFCNLTSASGASSNSILFLVDATTGLPSVKTYHANNYTVRVWHERINLNEGVGTDNSRHYFGTDAYMTQIGDDISMFTATYSGNNTTGKLGIGIVNASEKLHVVGNARVTGAYYDSNNSPGTSGQVLSSTATGTDWVSLSEISGVDGTGTANYIPKWTDSDTLGDSLISQSGSIVDINGTIRYDKQIASNFTSGAKAFIAIQSGGGAAKYKVYKNTNTTDGYARFKLDRAYDYGDSDQMVQEAIYQRRYTTKNVRFRYDGDITTADDSYLEFYELTDGTVEGWVCVDDYSKCFTEIYYDADTSETYPNPSSGTPTGTLIHSTNPDTSTPNWDSYQGNGYFSGNVGIGTTSPNEIAHVSRASSGSGLLLENSGGGGGSYVTLDFNTYNVDQANFANYGASIRVIDDGAFSGDITFRTKGAAVNAAQTEKMRIDGATGNVGIGTTSPGYKLHVAGNSYIDATSASAALTLGRYSGQPTIKAGSDDGGYLIMDSNGGMAALNWYTANNVVLAQGGGNVGIGMTNPSQKLDVNGRVRVGDVNYTYGGQNFHIVLAENTQDAYISNIEGYGIMSAGGYYYGANLRQLNSNSTAYSSMQLRTDGNIVFENITGATAGSIASANQRMIINSSGNVGIGTTSPSAKLEVAGDVIINDVNGNAELVMQGGAANNETYVIGQGILGVSNGGFSIRNSAEAKDVMVFQDVTGNVGIGTTSPSGKLNVIGKTQIEVSAGNVWMDLINSSESAFRLRTYNNGTGSGYASYAFKHGLYYNTTENAAITFWRGGSSIGGFLTFTTNNGLERMRIDSSGNVGIGTTSPSTKLEVAGTGMKLVNAANTHTHLLLDTATYDYKLGDISTTGGAYFQITSSTNQTYIYNSDLILSDGQQITITRSNPADPSCIYVDNTYTSFGTTYNIDSDVSSTFGSRHIGFRYNGTIVGFIGTNGTTAVTYSTSASDERLKKNIEDWQENILDKFEKIEPKEFNFISQEEGESKTKGFIAQNMAEDFPEAYPHDYSEDKYYSFNPSGMVVYLMKAVKDLVEQNKQLETRIQTLEQQKL